MELKRVGEELGFCTEEEEEEERTRQRRRLRGPSA